MDKKALTFGLQIGRILAGQRRKRVPVAYLYNGEKLQPLPEWDRTTYPYVLMLRLNITFFGNQVWVYYFRTRHHLNYLDSDGKYKVALEAGETYLQSYVRTDYNGDISELPIPAPVEHTANEADAFVSADNVHWANYDVFDENNAVLLEASAPVPVYE